MLDPAYLFLFRTPFQSQSSIEKKRAFFYGHITITRWHCFHFPQMDKCRASPWSRRIPICLAFALQADLFGPKNRLDLCLPVPALGFTGGGERPQDSGY